MTMQDFIQQTVVAIRDLPTLIKILALISSVTLEYIFPPFPGDTIVLFAGFLNAYDALLLVDISIAIFIGTLLGASLAYGAGRLVDTLKPRFSWLDEITKSPSYRQFGHWYRKWGIWFLLFNRFFPGIRALFFVAAGIERLPMWRVLVLGGLSALLWNACLVVLGYVLGFNAELIVRYFYQYNAAAMALLSIAILGLIFFVWKSTRR
jgi:membrane-associated protein